MYHTCKSLFYKNTLLGSILLLLLIRNAVCQTSSTSCSLNSFYRIKKMSMMGDLLVGGIFNIYKSPATLPMSPDIKDFESLLQEDFYNFLAFVFAIDEINNSSEILPNITLGYHVYDSTVKDAKAILSAFQLLSGTNKPILNYNCAKSTILAGIIEGVTPAASTQIKRISQIYKYPQVSFTSQDPVQTDTFPSFYRTIPNENLLHKGIAELLLHFDWKWIGIIFPSDPNSESSVDTLKNLLHMHGICVEFIMMAHFEGYYEDYTSRTFEFLIMRSTAKVILMYRIENPVHGKTNLFAMPGKVWISTADTSFNVLYNSEKTAVNNGSLNFIVRKKEIPAFLQFLKEVDQERFSQETPFPTWWDELCANFCPFTKKNRKCEKADKEIYLEESHCNLKFEARSYAVYNSVYALAHGLHNMLAFNKSMAETLKDESKRHTIQDLVPQKLQYFLKNIAFVNTLGERIHFINNEMSSAYDIYNPAYMPDGTVDTRLVGDITKETGFRINVEAITWDKNFSGIPKSMCSDYCEPGFRKSFGQSLHTCCFDCLPCPEGLVSPFPDSELCIPCSSSEWPNEDKTRCITKSITFFSFKDTLGIIFVINTIGLSLASMTTLGIFIKYRETAIVKANNRSLSYVLLVSLTFSILGSLLFIGEPNKWTCRLRQVIFGITFATSMSSILAKTLTMVGEFLASRIEYIRRWIGVKTPYFITAICPGVQILICVCWLLCSPPFPDSLNSAKNEIILHCNEGTTSFFYLVLSYLFVLANICFIFAFSASLLPNTFNEAKYITFGVLSFFIVWILFLLCYMGSKNKAADILEIFAIQVSSSALLACVFAPKLKIMILQPQVFKRQIPIIIIQEYNQ